MKYKNACEILPSELVEEIQKYIQGEFVYIPKKDKQAHNAVTEYKIELAKRNARVYTLHLEGISNEQLAKSFSLSESSIRRIVIEQRKRFENMSDKIKVLLASWGLQNESVKKIYGTVWQIGDNYVLKSYNESISLKRNITINQHLESMGIPVGELLITNEGEQYIEYEGYYFFVYKKLQGSNIVNLKFGNKIAMMMGEIIANLHIAFNSLEDKIEIWENALLDEMNGWVKESFERSGWQNVSRDTYENIVKIL